MVYRVEGIVIRSIDYGESNVIITIFTGEAGKVGVMVRGAKKPRSRYKAVTQLFTYGDFVYYKSKPDALGSLNSGEIIDAFNLIRTDLRMTAYAVYFVELIDRFVPDGEASEFLFAQLKAALEALNAGKDPQIIAFLLKVKLFQFAGISPVVDSCAGCGTEPYKGETVSWSASAGGVVCPRCGEHHDRIVIQAVAVKLIRLFQQTDLRQIGAINVKPETKTGIRQLLRQWIDVHSGVRFKSRSVLDQIELAYIDEN